MCMTNARRTLRARCLSLARIELDTNFVRRAFMSIWLRDMWSTHTCCVLKQNIHTQLLRPRAQPLVIVVIYISWINRVFAVAALCALHSMFVFVCCIASSAIGSTKNHIYNCMHICICIYSIRERCRFSVVIRASYVHTHTHTSHRAARCCVQFREFKLSKLMDCNIGVTDRI